MGLREEEEEIFIMIIIFKGIAYENEGDSEDSFLNWMIVIEEEWLCWFKGRVGA